jgi:hypothetical protein
MGSKLMSSSEAQQTRESLFRFGAPGDDLETYFDYMGSNQNFFIPVHRKRDGKVALYFSQIPEYNFGQCRFFMKKTHCDQWCHDVYLNHEKSKVMSLAVPQDSMMAPCEIKCYTVIENHYYLVDDLYSDSQVLT